VKSGGRRNDLRGVIPPKRFFGRAIAYLESSEGNKKERRVMREYNEETMLRVASSRKRRPDEPPSVCRSNIRWDRDRSVQCVVY